MLSLRPLPALRPVHQESVQCGYEKRVKKEKVSKPRNNFSTEYCEALHSLLSQSMIGNARRGRGPAENRMCELMIFWRRRVSKLRTFRTWRQLVHWQMSTNTSAQPAASTCILKTGNISLRNAGTNLQKYTLSHHRMVILTTTEPHLLHNTVNASVIILCSKIGFYKSQRREQSAACKSQLECCTHQISADSFPAENISEHTVYNIVTQTYIGSLHPTRKCLITFTVRGAKKFYRCCTSMCS